VPRYRVISEGDKLRVVDPTGLRSCCDATGHDLLQDFLDAFRRGDQSTWVACYVYPTLTPGIYELYLVTEGLYDLLRKNNPSWTLQGIRVSNSVQDNRVHVLADDFTFENLGPV